MMKADGTTQNDEAGPAAAASAVRVLFCLLPFAFCLVQTGCNVVGAIASKVAPPPIIPAKFAPAKEPTLVMVENFHNPAALRLESDSVARNLVEELKMNNVVPVVEPEQAEAFRGKQGPAYRKMPVDAIARALGATQVIYIDLETFSTDHAIASELVGGKAEARVRVVNDGGELLWPDDSAGGYPVAVKVEPQRVGPGGNDLVVRQQLHAALADEIAKLFYNWQSEGSDSAQETFSQQQ
jgi:hypothetical protein